MGCISLAGGAPNCLLEVAHHNIAHGQLVSEDSCESIVVLASVPTRVGWEKFLKILGALLDCLGFQKVVSVWRQHPRNPGQRIPLVELLWVWLA